MGGIEIIIMGAAAGVITFGLCGMYYTACKEVKGVERYAYAPAELFETKK
ncbi:hypothetical protein [Jeotgalibacillus terrae]|uniref:DUF3951 domain-containing protein n=1 Tax=Jeotgalibacillus terrae TaxID=587735 RepID=A0ABW5ZEU3_9BACL|nr:hypothetical protein [Jeotgalibacillus terrae]MBM7580055.1 hypothetical protein [Jeotgalibacillus terrae]